MLLSSVHCGNSSLFSPTPVLFTAATLDTYMYAKTLEALKLINALSSPVHAVFLWNDRYLDTGPLVWDYEKGPYIKCFCDIQIACSHVNGKYIHTSWPDITCTVDPQSPCEHNYGLLLSSLTMNNFLTSQQNSHIRIIIIIFTDSLSVVLSNLDAVKRWRTESFYNISYCTLQIIIIVSSVIIMVKWHQVADLSLKWTRF